MAKRYFRCDYSQYQSELCDNAVCIPLTHGKHTIIDAEDFDKIGEVMWVTYKNYVRCTKLGILHRRLMGTPDKYHTDHINHNTLDNRKINLRICSASENMANSRKRPSRSKHKGVYFNKEKGKWQAQITKKRKCINLGRFDNEDDAGRAYNEAAKKYFGEFANLNAL